jgi:mono/diheme cytochrome c family protein
VTMRHPEALRSRRYPKRSPELGSRRASEGDPQRAVWLVALSLLLAAACRAPSRPPKDAVQEAFKEDALTAQQARGHRVFLQRCATCHGPQGRGDGQNAYNLEPPPPDFQESLARLSPADRRKVVEGGTVALGRSPLCPPWGRTLGADDVDTVLAWLDVASRPSPAESEATPRPRWRRR